MKTHTKTLLATLALGAFAAASTNAALLDATRLSVDNIVGQTEGSGAAAGYYADNADGGRVGVTGSNGNRYATVLLFGYELPTLAVGETIESFEFSFDITAMRDHSLSDYELDVYLLSTAAPTASDYFRGPDDAANDLVGSTFIDDGGTEASVTLSPAVSVTHTINSGDALATLQSLYGGDHTPDQTEVFFRFNLDIAAELGGKGLNRYFVDADVSTSSLEITTVPEPGSLALLGLGGLCMLKRRRRS